LKNNFFFKKLCFTLYFIFFFSVFAIIFSILGFYYISFDYKVILFFIFASLISGIAPNLIFKNKTSRFSLKTEVESEIHLDKNKPIVYEKEVFLLFIILLIIDEMFFDNFILFILAFSIFFLIIYLLNAHFSFFKNSSFSLKDFFLVYIRYLLEYPKLIATFMLLGMPPNFTIITLIITFGSLFYYIVPKGIFLLELWIAVLFYFCSIDFFMMFYFVFIARFLSAFCNLIFYYVFEKFICLLFNIKN
jgi:hypothetical protein